MEVGARVTLPSFLSKIWLRSLFMLLLCSLCNLERISTELKRASVRNASVGKLCDVCSCEPQSVLSIAFVGRKAVGTKQLSSCGRSAVRPRVSVTGASNSAVTPFSLSFFPSTASRAFIVPLVEFVSPFVFPSHTSIQFLGAPRVVGGTGVSLHTHHFRTYGRNITFVRSAMLATRNVSGLFFALEFSASSAT